MRRGAAIFEAQIPGKSLTTCLTTVYNESLRRWPNPNDIGRETDETGLAS